MGHRKPAAQDGLALKRETVNGRPADILQNIVNDNLNYQVESSNYMLQPLVTSYDVFCTCVSRGPR